MSTDVIAGQAVPQLSRFVRMRFDEARGQHVLLGPESVVVLNATGTDVLRLCDGRTVDAIVAELEQRYGQVGEQAVGEQVRDFLVRLAGRSWVRLS